MEEFIPCCNNISKVKKWMKTNDIHDDDFALHWSTYYGHLEIMRKLIKLGVDIHVRNDFALRHSIYYKHLEVVRELIKANADIDTNNNHALYWSAKYGYLEVVRKLLKHFKYLNKHKYLITSLYDSRATHYVNIISIMFDLPDDLYDEIARFI